MLFADNHSATYMYRYAGTQQSQVNPPPCFSPSHYPIPFYISQSLYFLTWRTSFSCSWCEYPSTIVPGLPSTVLPLLLHLALVASPIAYVHPPVETGVVLNVIGLRVHCPKNKADFREYKGGILLEGKFSSNPWKYDLFPRITGKFSLQETSSSLPKEICQIFGTVQCSYFIMFILMLIGYEYYIFLLGCEPDMCHTLIIHLPGPLIFSANEHSV